MSKTTARQTAKRGPSQGQGHTHNRKAPDIMQVPAGEDILSVARRERAALRPSKPAVPLQRNPRVVMNLFKGHFIEAFGMEICKVAKHWGPNSKILARDYIKSLTTGDGTTPRALRAKHASTIQEVFIRLCAQKVVGHDTFPGQRQAWYQQQLATAS